MSSRKTNIEQLLKARARIDLKLCRLKTPITVLFSDVVGSTSYFERFGDAAGLALVQRHADLAANITAEFRGRVIKTIGDSVMAVFPEPVLAVRAAVEIQRRLLWCDQTLPEREELQVRIGINHGLVFRHDKDVYGDVVNVAARITKHTGPAQILVSSNVREVISLEADIPCTFSGKLTLEGKSDKEDVYEVIWTDDTTYAEVRQEATELSHPPVAATGNGVPGPQHRLHAVGTLIAAGLVAAFITGHMMSQAPKPPEKPAMEKEAAAKMESALVALQPAGRTASTRQHVKNSPAGSSEVDPAPSFYLRVARSANQSEANNQARLLQKLKFHTVVAYRRRWYPPWKRFYEVLVGPYQGLKRAETARRRLERQGFEKVRLVKKFMTKGTKPRLASLYSFLE